MRKPPGLNTKRNVWQAAKLGNFNLNRVRGAGWRFCKNRDLADINTFCPTGILNGIRNSSQSSLDKFYWLVKPTMFDIKPIGSPKQDCTSREEFEALVDKFFGLGE
jgi:hypothetical protein